MSRRLRSGVHSFAAWCGRAVVVLGLLGWPFVGLHGGAGRAWSQEPAAPAVDAAQQAAEMLKAEEPAADTKAGAATKPEEANEYEPREIDLLELMISGGNFMIPILLMSIVVVTFTVERGIALQRRKIVPEPLVAALGEVAEKTGRFNPREAYKLCQQYPSAAANVIRKALLKVGRPLPEIEHAVTEAQEREATKLYSNVRPIELGVSVAPLMGLLGTVWGMILCFFNTSNLPATANKAEVLAEGIYVALVTTLAGLLVAIPAAMIAHFFEGRIVGLFHDVDDLVQSLMPQLERFEGKMRVAADKPSKSDDELQPAGPSAAIPAPPR